MSLTKKLKPLFSHGDRVHGANFKLEGHVQNLTQRNQLITADVEDIIADYAVIIDLSTDEDAGVVLYCNCPRFHDGYPCQHLWATILEFDHTKQKTDRTKAKLKKPTQDWQTVLGHASAAINQQRLKATPTHPKSGHVSETEIYYVIDTNPSQHNELELVVMRRKRLADGDWGSLIPFSFSQSIMPTLEESSDRRIAAQLLGVDRIETNRFAFGMHPASFSNFRLSPYWSTDLCKSLVDSKRLLWTLDRNLPLEEFHRVNLIDFQTPAKILLQVQDGVGDEDHSNLSVKLFQQGDQINNEDVVMISESGVALMTDRILRIENPESLSVWRQTRNSPEVKIADKDRRQFLSQLANLELISHLQLPDSWKVTKAAPAKPSPLLRLTQSERRPTELCGMVAFTYGEKVVGHSDRCETFYDEQNNSWFSRNRTVEAERLEELQGLPITYRFHDSWVDEDITVNQKQLVDVVDKLSTLGWKIHLYGKPVRNSGSVGVSVASGQDWFDVNVNVDFDGDTIALPQMLKALSKKESFVELADGSHGRIPDEILEKYSRLAKFGQIEDDKVRFRPTQAMLLDAMIDAREVSMDRRFQRFREKLRSFDGVKPKQAPRGFQGKLRDYQADGLGWLHFLNEFQLGGCLADDMGLGKTIQVLSLLEKRRTRRVSKKTVAPSDLIPNAPPDSTNPHPIHLAGAELQRKPSIVVVPKSLIFNWIEEAAKFTPRIRFLNYTGTKRKKAIEDAIVDGGFDVLITTYGTMTKDIAELSQVDFDYAILDESQAIKNANAQCSKASRLLKAEHRLAMTGTPIENHLGELWSLFEFLNPGLLGSSANFGRLTRQSKNNEVDRDETLKALAAGLQPFLLRRTKEQVLTELPPKTEQTLYCDMLPAQKKAYKELKDFYRIKLTNKVETVGIAQSKIHVLEALLRLRQVACDPRLIDQNAKPGAKLELLIQQLTDVLKDGHKVLVFSQFTTFLKLVRQRFDQGGIRYEYLDGQSNKRQESVQRFQEDPNVQAFLISIKAGGHGLNLTAADYVFLLDPWWNPAVEAQAIDRAHRIGQNKPVIAYRMVCRDTVEEKILELQNSKRDLAEKVIQSDESLLRTLTPEDLQILFG